ncbi:putative urea ABC transporter substrate-binding protein [Hansschlegelia quercus]|uniref:Lipid kinase n=1 Tax=Hansschlegelia quercus TaxID=2528245 RepID=A0A4Q9G9L4_9HYPH|nr:putative urea ABC transporter substrate-binding protein [Hansschlegelia quercus]TBN47581.1 lipid kinase [Hansschlegelia quercus]
MRRFLRFLALGLAIGIGAFAALSLPAEAAAKKTFKIGYSVYVGFEPLEWLKSSGTMKRWADKYGIEVEIVQINDYVAGINQFIAGDLDAFAMANMDQLVMPAAGGVDTSLFLIGDYSNGNDAIVSKTAKSVKELEGKDIFLLQYSVSHYLLNRALIINGMKGVGAVKTTNISDAEISAAFISQPQMEHAVSWKPMIPDMLKGAQGSKIIFDSSQIPGEIMDVFVAKTETLKDNPDFGKAFTGAWYEALGHLKEGGAKADEVKSVMAAALNTDEAGLKTQMDTTHFFLSPVEAHAFLTAAKTKEIWNYVRTFCFEQGLYGQGADSVDAIGIQMSDGSVLGSEKNIRIRIDPTFTKLAADGKL